MLTVISVPIFPVREQHTVSKERKTGSETTDRAYYSSAKRECPAHITAVGFVHRYLFMDIRKSMVLYSGPYGDWEIMVQTNKTPVRKTQFMLQARTASAARASLLTAGQFSGKMGREKESKNA